MDIRQIAAQLGLDEKDVLEIAALFVETIPDEIQKMQDALDKRNAARVTNVAHSLKGSSASLGLLEVASLAQNVVRQGRENRLEDLDRSVPELVKTLQQETACIWEQIRTTRTGQGGR